jgi:hypothetical protein
MGVNVNIGEPTGAIIAPPACRAGFAENVGDKLCRWGEITNLGPVMCQTAYHWSPRKTFAWPNP